ncbi:MAG: hypothetical protein EOO38_23590, partial [Cytophagaceae bacterium]
MVVKIDRPRDLNIELPGSAGSATKGKQVTLPDGNSAQGVSSAIKWSQQRARSAPQGPVTDRLAKSPPMRRGASTPNAMLQAPRGPATHDKAFDIAQPTIAGVAPLSPHERLELAKPPMPLGSPLAGTREGVLTGITPVHTLVTILNSGKHQWYKPEKGDQSRSVKFDKYVGEVYLSDNTSEAQRMHFSTIKAESGT